MWNMFKVNNKNTKMTSVTFCWRQSTKKFEKSYRTSVHVRVNNSLSAQECHTSQLTTILPLQTANLVNLFLNTSYNVLLSLHDSGTFNNLWYMLDDISTWKITQCAESVNAMYCFLSNSEFNDTLTPWKNLMLWRL